MGEAINLVENFKVEKVIFNFLKEQKKKDNLYWRTNYNWEEYKIK